MLFICWLFVCFNRPAVWKCHTNGLDVGIFIGFQSPIIWCEHWFSVAHRIDRARKSIRYERSDSIRFVSIRCDWTVARKINRYFVHTKFIRPLWITLTLLAGSWAFCGLSHVNKHETKTTLNVTWPWSSCRLLSTKSIIDNWPLSVNIMWIVNDEVLKRGKKKKTLKTLKNKSETTKKNKMENYGWNSN